MPKYDIVVSVDLDPTGPDGNVFMIIGKVRQALAREVSKKAAEEFVEEAWAQDSYDDVLDLVRETVEVV